MNKSIPAAPTIKKYAKEFLCSNPTMTTSQLQDYIYKQTGETFTSGSYAGALRSLLDSPDYSTTSRGVYTYNPVQALPKLTISHTDSLTELVNRVLENTIENLRQVASVNLLEKDEQEIKKYFEGVLKLKEIITQIEKLKV